MENNKENSLKLANRIYELDEKVYKSSGSELGRTLAGPEHRNISELALLITINPQGHLLRSELALIGNMARTIRDKKLRREVLEEYNAILEEIESLPSSFGSVDIVDKDLAALNPSARRQISEKDRLIICISRSHGSAGTDIGFALSEALRINYYDEEVLNEVLSRREMKKFGEEGAKTGNFSKYHGLPKRDALFFKQSDLICELAQNEDMIIMGRAADAVLAGRHIPHISIYITAPVSARVNRIMEIKNIDMKQALSTVRKMDRKHRAYYHAYTGRQWGNAINYDLCINSACYGIEESVELIERLIDRKRGKKRISGNPDTVEEAKKQ